MINYSILIKTLSLLFLSFIANTLFAQVTIGSSVPAERASLLEIKTQEADSKNITSSKGGLGLPRVYLVDKTTLEPFVPVGDTDWVNAATSKIKEKHAGLMVYNIYVSPDAETDSNKIFKQGVYVWNGTNWVLETQDKSRYFSPPSFNIPLAAIGTTLTFDLHKQYEEQFTKAGNTTFVSSNAALTTIPSPYAGNLYKRSELDFAITYYDGAIIENVSVDANGVMSYKVKSLDVSANSFVNVVFIIK